MSGRVAMFFYLSVWVSFFLGNVHGETVNKFPLLMPHVRPERAETYFCTPIRIDPTSDYYITAFEPNATMDTAHHMLLYACEEPGTDQEVWNCGEMALAQRGLPTAPVCKKGNQVIYAWARDAPTLVLPDGVGFGVGGRTALQYLVLQVHYASVEKFKDGSTDDSGIFVYYTTSPQPMHAGVLLLGTGGRILPNSVEYMETSCVIQDDTVIHPFAFRTHTHSLGRVVAGYKVTQGRGGDAWELIGKKDPQLPQMFYPVANNVTLSKGDTVAARCTMLSQRNRVTRVGSTNEDEMCNFYIMYATKGKILSKTHCFSLGPPFYYWNLDGFRNIPDNDASSLAVGESAAELGVAAHHI